jgi:glycosyltransferase involved in cell wall biosynthesis
MMNVSENNHQQPSVSILMASYGRLELLKDAVDSALKQVYSNFELIIVDDGSDGDVISWLKRLAQGASNITVYYQKHQGVAAARAHGVEQARTELICILDSDDLLAADALEKLVEAIEKKPGTQLVYCNIRELRDSGEVSIQHYQSFTSPQAMLKTTLMKPRLPFKHSGTLFRRQTALDLGSYDVDLPCKVDIDLYLKFLTAGYLPVHVDAALVDFRMHKNSVSINRLLGIKVWLYLIDKYGPASVFHRLYIKTVRVIAELLKRLYVEMIG